MSHRASSITPRVLFVARSLDIGGTENHILHVLPRLRDYGIDVDLFVLERGGRLEAKFLESGVAVYGLPRTSYSVLRILIGAWYLYRHFRTTRPDIAHFFLPEPYLIGALASMAARIKIRIMSRRSLANYQRRHPALAVIETLLHRRTQILLGNSSAVVEDLIRECCDRSKVGLIYNGIAISKEISEVEKVYARWEIGLAPRCFVLAIVASLIGYKGHEDLFNALALVNMQLPSGWQLLVIGQDKGIRAQLEEKVVALGLNEHVCWIGEVQSAEPYFDAADVAIVASHEEGFSNSLLEAMARGLPVVATRVGGNIDAVVEDETGILVPAKAPAAMAEAILRLATDAQLRTRIGEAARRRTIELFSIESCVRRYVSLYESAAQLKFTTSPVQSLIDNPGSSTDMKPVQRLNVS